MRTYKPSTVPEKVDRQFVQSELQAIQRAANQAQTFFILQPLSVLPDRLEAGMVIYANASLSLGSGEGVYVRNAANSAWRYLG